MTILETFIQLKNDIIEWATNNFNNKSDVDHTHNYAGSSSPGGVASKATSATSATYATTATKAGTATYANNSGTATYSNNSAKASSATSATYASTATKAGTASYASNAPLYKGATTASAGTSGFVPSATTATRTAFLRGDGTWATPSNASSATYSSSAGSASKASSATSATYASTATKAGTATYATNSGTASYSNNSSTAAYATNSGTASYSNNSAKATSATSATYATTAASAGSATKATSATSATYATTATSAGSASKATSATSATYASTANYAKNSRTYVGATTAASGTSGFVPAATTATRTKFLRGDGTWQTPTNTTYSNMAGATSASAGKAGLVPAPAAGNNDEFLRGDGTWAMPNKATSATSATYASTATKAGTATYATNSGTSAYSSNGAKATSATSATYATTATKAGTANALSGLTATTTELNYMDGVTSNVQTQIDTLNNSLNTKVTGNRISQINWNDSGYMQAYVDNATWVSIATKTSVDSVSSTANAGYTRANSSVPYEVYLSNGTDLNTVVASGFYRLNTGHANNPNSSGYYACDWSQMIVCHGGGDTIMQIIVDYSTATMFVRSGTPSNVGGTGSWTAWKRVIDNSCFSLSGTTLTITV